ncbi:hypothetical protein HPB47_024640, partial [Ixodes persulcatus]
RSPAPQHIAASQLQAINNTAIATYGKRSLTVDFRLRHTFCWVFVCAVVPHAIIRADVLTSFGPLVDVKGRCFRDESTRLTVQGMLRP